MRDTLPIALVFIAMLALGVCASSSASAQVGRDIGWLKRFGLGATMELDFVGDNETRDDLLIQRIVYRPAIVFDSIPGWQTAHPFKARRLQLSLGGELSYSRSDRLFSGGDASFGLSCLWFSLSGGLRSNYGVWTAEWLRVRLSAGKAWLTVDDRTADTSETLSRWRLETAAFTGVRIWSFLVLQFGVSSIFGPDSMTWKIKGEGKRRIESPKERLAAVVRVGIEYRFGDPRSRN